MWLVAYVAEAGEIVLREENDEGKQQLIDWGWPKVEQIIGQGPANV